MEQTNEPSPTTKAVARNAAISKADLILWYALWTWKAIHELNSATNFESL